MEWIVNRKTAQNNRRGALVIMLLSALLSACATHQPSNVIIEDRTGSDLGSPAVTTSPAYESETATPPQSDDDKATSVETTPQPSGSQPAYQQQISPMIEPQGAVLALLEQAENQHQQGKNQQALTSLERAQRINPRQPLVYLQLSQLHKDMGQIEKAKQFAQKGLSLSGDDARLTQAFNLLLR